MPFKSGSHSHICIDSPIHTPSDPIMPYNSSSQSDIHIVSPIHNPSHPVIPCNSVFNCHIPNEITQLGNQSSYASVTGNSPYGNDPSAVQHPCNVEGNLASGSGSKVFCESPNVI